MGDRLLYCIIVIICLLTIPWSARQHANHCICILFASRLCMQATMGHIWSSSGLNWSTHTMHFQSIDFRSIQKVLIVWQHTHTGQSALLHSPIVRWGICVHKESKATVVRLMSLRCRVRPQGWSLWFGDGWTHNTDAGPLKCGPIIRKQTEVKIWCSSMMLKLPSLLVLSLNGLTQL